MNAESTAVNNQQEEPPPTKQYSTAQLLRFGGAGLFLLSGIIYMLQGYGELQDSLRYWVYVALGVLLCAGGLFSQKMMLDAKGARLFFVLAMLVVPLQATQLGAMLFTNTYQSGSELFSTISISLVALATMVWAIVASYLGFSVLAKGFRLPLTANFLLYNSLLLIPSRTGLTTAVVVSFMLIAFVINELKYFGNNTVFATLEGKTCRALLLLPALIMLPRFGFSINENLGVAFIAISFGLTASFVIVSTKLSSFLSETLRFIATLSFVFGLTLIFWEIGDSSFERSKSSILYAVVSLTVLALIAQYKSRSTWIYRLLQIFFAIPLFFYEANHYLWIVMLIAVAFLTVSIYTRAALTTITYTLVLCSCLLSIDISRFFQFEVSAWFGLAIAGIALVGLSSLAERYGNAGFKKAIVWCQNFRQWQL